MARPFQFGDRVRIRRDDDLHSGRAGTVTRVLIDTKPYIYGIDFRDGGRSFFHGEDLELIAPGAASDPANYAGPVTAP